ncbi:MAG TPA: hypothetical protein VF595_14935 [Tepidisphaeraceae bacterium]|jgi:hypothetical protein
MSDHPDSSSPTEPTGDHDVPPVVTKVDAALAVRLAWRGVWSARLARYGLLCLAIAGFLLAKEPTLPAGMGLLFATAAAWVVLITRTARNQQDLIRVPAWIEAGQLDRADGATMRALGRFSVAGRPRVQSLRFLATSLNARQRHDDARRVATAALGYRQPKPAADTLQLIIAESALATGDVVAAHAALSQVVAPLPLRDSLKLLELQTDYCVRVGAWPHAVHDLPAKVEMSELLPADASAAVQAMLALAARRLGQTNWSDWLVRRATLLTDIPTLVRRRPVLAELFGDASA